MRKRGQSETLRFSSDATSTWGRFLLASARFHRDDKRAILRSRLYPLPKRKPMKRFALLILTLGLAASLDAAEEKAGPKGNMPPPGFTALFNGRDLTGWQGLGRAAATEEAEARRAGRKAEGGQREIPAALDRQGTASSNTTARARACKPPRITAISSCGWTGRSARRATAASISAAIRRCKSGTAR